jgi:uncharacterized Ntn-hydrolase superfamily protein
MTYSIVARDRATGQLGIGLQSHFFSVGSVASFAAPGIGAIATQAFASRQYGPLGLQMLAAGMPSPAVLDDRLLLRGHDASTTHRTRIWTASAHKETCWRLQKFRKK